MHYGGFKNEDSGFSVRGRAALPVIVLAVTRHFLRALVCHFLSKVHCFPGHRTWSYKKCKKKKEGKDDSEKKAGETLWSRTKLWSLALLMSSVDVCKRRGEGGRIGGEGARVILRVAWKAKWEILSDRAAASPARLKILHITLLILDILARRWDFNAFIT